MLQDLAFKVWKYLMVKQLPPENLLSQVNARGLLITMPIVPKDKWIREPSNPFHIIDSDISYTEAAVQEER